MTQLSSSSVSSSECWDDRHTVPRLVYVVLRMKPRTSYVWLKHSTLGAATQWTIYWAISLTPTLFFSVSGMIQNNSQGTDLIRFRSFSNFKPACFGGCDKWQNIDCIYEQTTSCGREGKMSIETFPHIARVSATASSFVATTDKYRSMS